MQWSEIAGPYGRHFRQLFYLVTPSETTFPNLETLPDFLDESIPWIALLMVLELFVCRKKIKEYYSLADSLISFGAGSIQTMTNKVFLRTVEITIYAWVYENYSVHKLPPDSTWTWLASFFAVDFFYYWLHRAAHEINIFWALHQTHHNSEYYNIVTALRQGAIQQQLTMFFYLPASLFIPPPIHVAHEIINRLYQIWIHTPVLGKLGPLEWIFNTPSHHRVHHGRNPYCIDKNYAGTLIIWDRMFGTFQAELESEPVAYGLVHNINSFDPMEVQLCHLRHIFFEKIPSVPGLTNKLKALFYGPGWMPGKPRLGNPAEIPEIERPIRKYHTGVAAWVMVYALFQGICMLFVYQTFTLKFQLLPWTTGAIFSIVSILSVYILGCLLEKRSWAPLAEVFRSLVAYYWIYPLTWGQGHIACTLAQIFSAICALFWIIILIARQKRMIKVHMHEYKKD